MTDQQGNAYKTVKIGTQEWMAENLHTSRYANGDLISTNLSNAEWINTNETQLGAWSYYGNNTSYSCPYGKLYNWYACVDPRGLCPTGWNLPTDEDWNTLINFLDPNADGGNNYNSAGGLLKTEGTSQSSFGYWSAPNTGASNSAGFSALPGGVREYAIGGYYALGTYGGWWSTSENNTNSAWARELNNYNEAAFRNFNMKQNGLSVRCWREASYSCELILGCTQSDACNYNPTATDDDGSYKSSSSSLSISPPPPSSSTFT
jgi:uncharacterized protein (TIGR02145 family)